MKKTGKIVAISLSSVVLLLGIAGIVFKLNSVKTQAKGTLPGIEAITNANSNANPFVIVEVVNDKNNAALGYLIGGEEPIFNGKSLHDMPVMAERTDATDFFNANYGSYSTFMALANADAVVYDPANPYYETSTPGENTRTMAVRGYYPEAGSGDYTFTRTEAVFQPWLSATDINAPKYSRYLDFSFGGNYSIALGYIYDASCLTITDGASTYPIADKYSVTATPMAGMDPATFGNYVGIFVYNAYIDGAIGADPTQPLYIQEGIVTTSIDGSGTIVVADLGGSENALDAYVDENSTYCFLTLSINSVAGDYCVRSFTAGVTNGGFDKKYHYELNPSANDDEAYALVTEATGNVDYTPGVGDHSFIADYSYGVVDNIIYDGGLYNREWFKGGVFDSTDPSNLIVDVKTVTLDEFNAMDLSKVNLVYLSAGNYAQDMSDGQAKSLIENVIKGLPIILETGFDSGSSWSNNSNNYRVMTALRQDNVKGLNIENIKNNWSTEAYWDASTGLASKMRSISSANYLYVDSCVLVSYGSGFVAADFLSAVPDELFVSTSGGLSPVAAEISSENFYRRNAGTEIISETISKATAIRYIINYSKQRVIIKNKISVLEIEPCYSFGNYIDSNNGSDTSLYRVYNVANGRTVNVTNINRRVLTKNYIANNWATQFKNSQNNITLTQVSSSEFIGKVEDLNETYDLIYIGLDTSTMNTVISGNTKTAVPLYNDSSLGNRIYTHVGDIIEDRTGNRAESFLYWPGKYDNVFNERLSGNDITYSKLVELEAFIQAGYPVVFADGFFVTDGAGYPTSVSSSVIDPDSNMYKLGQFCLGQRGIETAPNPLTATKYDYTNRNVFYDSAVREADAIRNRLADYLNISKLSVTMAANPTPYFDRDGNAQYLRRIDGKYTLEYIFTLTNEAAVDVNNTRYNVELFIDTSVDGRFTEAELIPSIMVYEVTGSGEVFLFPNATGQFELMAGKTYALRREVPTGYSGILPWKLVFSQLDNPNIRVSSTGYTAVQIAAADRPTIKVLQIGSAGNSGCGLFGLFNGTDDSKNNLNLETNTQIHDLFSQVQDFTITTRYVNSYEFLGKTERTSIFSGFAEVPSVRRSVAQYYDIIDDYDMLIFGFSDCFKLGNSKQQSEADKLCQAVSQYIESGKIVLFTHDTTSFFNRDTTWYENLGDALSRLFGTDQDYWGYSFNKYLRGVVGMDRFNIFGSSTRADVYSPAGLHTDNLTQGYSNNVLRTYNNQTNKSKGSSRSAFYNSARNIRGGNYDANYYVTKLNEGQITTYPFKIPDTFQVSDTHGQYYQLNLDSDPWDADMDDDVVVWYCISNLKNSSNNEIDDVYQATYNDARNNYYIYSIGNVMYSGVGHSAVTEENELKLFVNTMVAAYQSTVFPPTVSFVSGETNAYEIGTTYMPYDNVEGDFVTDSDIVLYFDIVDNSFIQGTRSLENHYYIEVPAGTRGATTITTGGVTYNVVELRGSDLVVKAHGSNVSHPEHLNLDTLYSITIPASRFTGAGMNMAHVFVSAQTTYTMVSGKTITSSVGYYSMSVVRTELFELE